MITVILLITMTAIDAVSKNRDEGRDVFPAFGERGRYQKAMTVAWRVGFLLHFVPYGVVAAQTVIFGETFRPLVKQALADGIDNPDDTIVTLRVMKITPQSALVYIVQGDAHATQATGKVSLVIDFTNTPPGLPPPGVRLRVSALHMATRSPRTSKPGSSKRKAANYVLGIERNSSVEGEADPKETPRFRFAWFIAGPLPINRDHGTDGLARDTRP